MIKRKTVKERVKVSAFNDGEATAAAASRGWNGSLADSASVALFGQFAPFNDVLECGQSGGGQ